MLGRHILYVCNYFTENQFARKQSIAHEHFLKRFFLGDDT